MESVNIWAFLAVFGAAVWALEWARRLREQRDAARDKVAEYERLLELIADGRVAYKRLCPEVREMDYLDGGEPVAEGK